jgi:hypothetical protein
VEVDPRRLSKYESEPDFLSLAFDLLREAASYVCIAANVVGPGGLWTRDQAVIGGHIVRLFKLMSVILDQVGKKRREPSDIAARLAFETIVNVRYIVEHFSPALLSEFIRHSLRHSGN